MRHGEMEFNTLTRKLAEALGAEVPDALPQSVGSSVAKADGKGKKKGKKGGKAKAKAQDQSQDETYSQMLAKFFELLREKRGRGVDPDRKVMVKRPEVQRIGTNKTSWVNFQEISDMLCRPPDHLYKFFFNELNVDGSVSGTQLLFKKRVLEKEVEATLRKYINEYVRCPLCKSMQTDLTRDPSIRVFRMKCEQCGGTRTVEAIKELYHHVSRGERKKAR